LIVFRKIKWVAYWVQIAAFFALGWIARVVPRDRKSIVLTGDLAYSGGTLVYFLALIDLFNAEGLRVTVLVPRRYYRRRLQELVEPRKARLLVVADTYQFAEHLQFAWHVAASRAARVVVSATGPGRHTLSILWRVPSIHIMHAVVGPGVDARARRLLGLFLRGPHRVVGVSRITRDTFRRYFRIFPSRWNLVSFVYNGVPDTGIAPPPPSGGPWSIVTVGHVVGYKNPSTWLQTARYVTSNEKKEIRFVWVGEGPDLDSYRSKVAQEQSIRFIGYSNDAAAVIRTAAVYYQPSRLESFGLSVAEAMSMGIPCVVSDCGGLPELVEDGRNGFVCAADDWAAQSAAIRRLLEDRELWMEMSREARRIYQERFSLRKWRQEIMGVISGNPAMRCDSC
jgi:glycosyltransferase involved in cell wall biosynthesis